jgi:hypothetical protein
MKTLTRVLAVLAVMALAAPALACQEMMQQTTADKAAEKPVVARAEKVKKSEQAATAKAKTKAQTELAKAQLPKPAQN